MITSTRQKPKYFLALSYVMPLLNLLRERGISLSPLLELMELSAADLVNPDAHFNAVKINPMWALAEQLSDDKNIGLHAGMQMQIGHIGILGHLVLTCARGYEAFDVTSRFYNLVGNSDVVKIEYSNQEIKLRSTIKQGFEPYCRHSNEFNLASWVKLGRFISSSENKPTAVYIPNQAPDNDDEQKQFFGCAVHYNADRSAELVIPAEYAELPLMATEPGLKLVLEAAANDRLLELQGSQADNNPLLAKLKQFILKRLYQGPPSLDKAAEHLDLAPRSLQKNLEQLGSNYSQQLDLVRKQQAENLIKKPELSLVEVALMLGFSEQSSFQRAFKRWFDITPTAYRKLGLTDSAGCNRTAVH